MKRYAHFLIFLLAICLLAACSNASEPTPTETTFEIIHLQISTALQQWLPKIAACAEDIQNFGITTNVLPDADLDLSQADLIVRLGDRVESDPYVVVLGTEEIVIFTSEGIDLDAISLESLQAIFDGSITNWNDLPEFSKRDIEGNQAITVLTYPEGDIVRHLFSKSYLNEKPLTGGVEEFSTIDFLTDYINENPNIIGYGLESQLPQNASQLEITGFDQASAVQYVLAVTPQEPQGTLVQLLLCIQE